MPSKTALQLLVACFFVVLGFSSSIAAKTPDGQTPAQETICDPLIDATPSLYGLCVAYCEAQDCDDESFVSGQCEAPNPRILENYNRKKTADDPEMPCLPMDTPCPCFTAEDLAALNMDRCSDRDTGTVQSTSTLGSNDECRFGNLRADQSLMSSGADFGTCRILDFSSSCDVTTFIQTMDLTLEESDACRQLILDEVAARGLICP